MYFIIAMENKLRFMIKSGVKTEKCVPQNQVTRKLQGYVKPVQ